MSKFFPNLTTITLLLISVRGELLAAGLIEHSKTNEYSTKNTNGTWVLSLSVFANSLSLFKYQICCRRENNAAHGEKSKTKTPQLIIRFGIRNENKNKKLKRSCDVIAKYGRCLRGGLRAGVYIVSKLDSFCCYWHWIRTPNFIVLESVFFFFGFVVFRDGVFILEIGGGSQNLNFHLTRGIWKVDGDGSLLRIILNLSMNSK